MTMYYKIKIYTKNYVLFILFYYIFYLYLVYLTVISYWPDERIADGSFRKDCCYWTLLGRGLRFSDSNGLR